MEALTKAGQIQGYRDAKFAVLVRDKRILLYVFVIMPNPIHLIWQLQENSRQADVQRDFLKYTAQQIKFDWQQNHPAVLEKFRVQVKDRSYQIWEHRPLSVLLWSKLVFDQKLNYIHQNPVPEK